MQILLPMAHHPLQRKRRISTGGPTRTGKLPVPPVTGMAWYGNALYAYDPERV